MIARFHYDDSRLTELLQDEGSVGSDELLEHLETCEECQARLDTLSSGGLSWDEVNELMRKDDPKVAELVGRYDEQREERESLATSATFLRSSDYPDSLGRFARYEVMEFLGRGGMGIVMRAYDTALQRNCAVKVLAPELASSAAARKRFSREARSAAAVVHPHVVPIQTVDEHNGLPYLVMPVVDGRSLQQRTEADGPLSVVETVRIAAQVAEGLAAAHAQGLVHRDIKPANILLENGVERVQLTDFGLARAIDDASMTRSGVIAGTPQYMSPEQAHGDPIDHRSDLFSLGSVMYFMLTGRSPFRAETTMGVLNRIGNDDPRSLRSINAEVPEWLEAIVIKLLAKSRDGRFATAEEVAELLSGCLAHLQEPITTSLPATTPSFSGKPQASARSQLSQSLNPSRLRLAVMRISQPPIRWLVAAAAFAFFAINGTIIYLETGKGTLRIETNSESEVPIVIRQGDEVVEHLTVSKQGTSMRLKAGNYVLQIDDVDPEFIITDGEVVLKRGGQWLAHISESQQKKDVDERGISPSSAQALPAAPRYDRSITSPNQSQPLIGTWRLLRWLNANGDPATEVVPDNSVMTIEDSYVTIATDKVSPDENYFYRLLPGDVLHLIEISDNSKGGTETKIEYSFPKPNSLRFETLYHSGGASGWGSEWQRVGEKVQSNVAQQIPPADLYLTNPSIPGVINEWTNEPDGVNFPVAAPVANDLSREPRLAQKTNQSKLMVKKEDEFEPSLLIEWDVDEGISWLFSEPPIRREKLGSFPYAFNLGPNEKPNISMINSDGRRIKTRWWMECQDANDRFWEMLRGKRIEIPVSNVAYNIVADGGTVRMVIYLPENNGQYADSLDTLKSTRVETDVLELAKERGQPIISVLMEPVSDSSSQAIESRVDEVENLEPTRRRDDHPESRSEPKTQSPSPATHRAGIDDRKRLSVRLLGDKKLAINHPAKSEGEVPDGEPQPFTSDGIVLVFSLETPGAESCYHILDSNFNSIRAVVRLECSEYLSEAYWQRLGTQPIELSVSHGEFTSVLSGNLQDTVVYLPDEKAGDPLQTKSYSGIGRPNDVVDDVRKMGGQPLVSIRLDPPTAADQVAKSHQRVGPTFNSGRSTTDFFNRCSDEELLQALQGSWAQPHFNRKGTETNENPDFLQEKPLRVTFEGTSFHWNNSDSKANSPKSEKFTLSLNGPSTPRKFSLDGNDTYPDGLKGVLQLTPDGELSIGLGREPVWKIEANDQFLIKARRLLNNTQAVQD